MVPDKSASSCWTRNQTSGLGPCRQWSVWSSSSRETLGSPQQCRPHALDSDQAPSRPSDIFVLRTKPCSEPTGAKVAQAVMQAFPVSPRQRGGASNYLWFVFILHYLPQFRKVKPIVDLIIATIQLHFRWFQQTVSSYSAAYYAELTSDGGEVRAWKTNQALDMSLQVLEHFLRLETCAQASVRS